MPAFLTAFLSKAGLWLTGKMGPLVGSILFWVLQKTIGALWQQAMDSYEERKRRQELELKDAEILKRYEEIVNAGEGVSREARRKIAEDLLNRNSP